MKVYVIDDEPKIRRGLVHFIAHERPDWPYPNRAATAEQALADPAFASADLLFLDIQLPDMNGLELLEKLRAEGRKMQVIIISGYAEFSFAQKAMSLQVQDYLLKPISVQKLNKILTDAEELYLRSQQDQRILETAHQNLHMVQEKYFSNILFGAEPGASPDRLKELHMEDSPFLLVQYTYQNTQEDHSNSVREVKQLLADKLRDHLPGHEQLFLIFLKTSIVAILVAPNDELDKILEAFQGNSDTHDYLVGSSFVHQSLSELLIAYREATRSDIPPDEVAQNVPVTDQTVYVDQLIKNQEHYHPYVQNVLLFIAGNYQNVLNLAVISAHVHLHSSYLSDLFKRETGTNLCNYITDYRLRIAKQEIRSSGCKIAAIAEHVGFNDYHYFSQVFSKRVGISPRKYRMSQ